MKLRLLKPLPWAEVGTVWNWDFCTKAKFWTEYYKCDTLISSWWAEEIKEPERWEPKLRETYYKYAIYTERCHPISEGKSFESVWAEKKMAQYWLCTKTREELETTLLLLKLRQSNGGWKPKEGELYYNLAIWWCVVFENFEEDDDLCVNDILIGNCYRTSEEAVKYAPEWKKLFDSVK